MEGIYAIMTYINGFRRTRTGITPSEMESAVSGGLPGLMVDSHSRARSATQNRSVPVPRKWDTLNETK